MKLYIQVGSDVIGRSIETVAKAFGHERVEDPEAADVVICADDTRQMLTSLKHGKRVIQFLTQPSMEPAEELRTAYPDRFTVCTVVPFKGLEGCEMLITALAKLAGKEDA